MPAKPEVRAQWAFAASPWLEQCQPGVCQLQFRSLNLIYLGSGPSEIPMDCTAWSGHNIRASVTRRATCVQYHPSCCYTALSMSSIKVRSLPGTTSASNSSIGHNRTMMTSQCSVLREPSSVKVYFTSTRSRMI